MNCVPKRFLNAHIFRRNLGIVFPNDHFGNRKIFRKCAIRIDAQNFKVLANVHLSCQALLAVHAGDVRFDRNRVAFFDARDHTPFFYYNSRRFVPGGIGNILMRDCAHASHS